MMKIVLKTYLNCGNAQARKRNRRPMEPLKARATKAGKEKNNKRLLTVVQVGNMMTNTNNNL